MDGDGLTATLGFYRPAEASRITRIPKWTVHSWKREGIIVPTVQWKDETGKQELGYSFEELAYLRLLRMLRENDIPLIKAVSVVDELRKRFGPFGKKWEQARIFSEHGEVFVHAKDEWGTEAALRGGQKVADELFGEDFARLRDRADALLIPRRFEKYVVIDPAIRSGLPVVFNTTIPTFVIRRLRQRGFTYEHIREWYPLVPLRLIKGADKYEQFLDSESIAA